MAKKKGLGQMNMTYSPPDHDRYMCEEDVRTLTRAAEVMADKGRASMAMKAMKKTRSSVDKLVDVLGRRSKAGGGY